MTLLGTYFWRLAPRYIPRIHLYRREIPEASQVVRTVRAGQRKARRIRRRSLHYGRDTGAHQRGARYGVYRQAKKGDYERSYDGSASNTVDTANESHHK